MLTETNKTNIEVMKKIANQGKFVRLEYPQITPWPQKDRDLIFNTLGMIDRGEIQPPQIEDRNLSTLFPHVFDKSISATQIKTPSLQ